MKTRKAPSPLGVSRSVERTIRRMIIEGELAPGTRLVETRIGELLGVSKTPVRDALTSLAKTGLVEAQPFRGSQVIEITPTFVDEVLEMRQMLETAAVERSFDRLSAENLEHMESLAVQMEESAQRRDFQSVVERDAEFHRHFFEVGGQRLLLEFWSYLEPRIQLIQSYGRMHSPPTPSGTDLKSHQTYLEAIRSRDVGIARDAVIQHIENGRRRIYSMFQL